MIFQISRRRIHNGSFINQIKYDQVGFQFSCYYLVALRRSILNLTQSDHTLVSLTMH